MCVWMSIFTLATRHTSLVEWLDWLRLRNFVAAVFAGAALVVVPEIEHGLTEMFDDIGAIEVDVVHYRPAVVAIEDHMLAFAGRATPLDDHADRVRRSHRRVRNIRRDEKCFTFAHQMIDNAVALADSHFDVALELITIFLRID